MHTTKTTRWNFGLRARATIAVASLVTLAVLAASIFNVTRTNQILKMDQEMAVDGLSSGFAAAIELSLTVGDDEEVDRISKEFFALVPGAEFIIVRDFDNKLRSLTGNNPYLETTGEEDLVESEQLMIRKRVILSQQIAESDQSYFDTPELEELDPAEQVEIGMVVIGVSNDALHAAQRSQWESLAITILAVVLIATPVIHLVVGGWTKRLTMLVEVAQYISRGDYSQQLPSNKEDEIGQVYSAYEHMREAIRERNESEQRRQAELLEARVTADTANQAKSQFLAHMSHEIRTPINGVIGMLELLSMTDTSEKQKKQIRTATSSADTLLGLINDILDFSKIEAGQIDIESISFDLHDVYETVTEMLAHLAAKKGVELICNIESSVPRYIKGDPTRVRQVLINIVNNAIKFTESGSIVTKLIAIPTADDQWSIRTEVADTGIGIPEAQRSRLFKSFSQVDSTTTRKFGGTGLGLAISKGFVQLMGGDIGISPDRKIGSEFWFTFAACQSEKADEGRPVFRGVLENMRTIIVDDNQVNLDIYTEALTNWGMRPEGFLSAQEGLEALVNAEGPDQFELAILDMQMPNMDGVQLADAIVSNESITTPNMVMLTSMYHTPDAEDLQNLCIAACLQKPVRLSTLHDALAQYMYDGNEHKRLWVDEQITSEVDLAGARILVAEDNSVNQLVIGELLKSAGIEVDIVNNGAEAVSRVDAEEYDILLMDCEMPELDGYEATRWIRSSESARKDSSHITIIALTANAIQGDRERCIDVGMNDYLTKPINAKKLFSTLRKWYQPKDDGDSLSNSKSNEEEALEKQGGASEQAILDIDGALQRCAGSVDILNQVLDEFERITQCTSDEFSQSFDDQDLDAVRLLAHSLKGAAANIGAEDLAEQSKALEAAAMGSDQEGAQDAFRSVEQCLSKLHKGLPSIRQQLTELES